MSDEQAQEQPKAPPTPIARYLWQTDSALAELQETITAVYKRLDPVLSIQTEAPVLAAPTLGPGVSETASVLAAHLAALSRLALNATARLRALLDRLEV